MLKININNCLKTTGFSILVLKYKSSPSENSKNKQFIRVLLDVKWIVIRIAIFNLSYSETLVFKRRFIRLIVNFFTIQVFPHKYELQTYFVSVIPPGDTANFVGSFGTWMLARSKCNYCSSSFNESMKDSSRTKNQIKSITPLQDNGLFLRTLIKLCCINKHIRYIF